LLGAIAGALPRLLCAVADDLKILDDFRRHCFQAVSNAIAQCLARWQRGLEQRCNPRRDIADAALFNAKG
jgi:hypothetical protein